MAALGWVGVAIGWVVVLVLAWKQATEQDEQITAFQRRAWRYSGDELPVPTEKRSSQDYRTIPSQRRKA